MVICDRHRSATSYQEHLWWTIQHSTDKTRKAVMISCYFDESGTDDLSPIAVLGGVVLQGDGFLWLDHAWGKMLVKHSIQPPLHMKEFGQHGRFKHLSHEQRRALFTDLTWIINDNKNASIGTILTTEQYKKHFLPFVSEKQLSVYGLCFLLAAMLMGRYTEIEGYCTPIPYVLDTGNKYRTQVDAVHAFIVEDFQKVHPVNMGSLTFDTDDNVRALQAADVVAWSVRRNITANFNGGFEPLLGIFDERHIAQPLEEDWLIEIAEAIQAKGKT